MAKRRRQIKAIPSASLALAVGFKRGYAPLERICINCFDTTSVRNCNDCHKLCRSEFSTCWTCHKTDICDYCITIYRYDDGEELCTECNIKKNKRYEERNRDWREEYERREAEHRRNWGGYKKNT